MSYQNFVQAKVLDYETREIIGSGIFEVNQTRKFTIDDETIIYLDKNEIDYTTFEIIGSGFKSAFILKDTNNNIDVGKVDTIELITDLQGPVTSVFPIMVLEQPVLTTSDTVNVLSNPIQHDQLIAISGYLSENNSYKATRVMSPNEAAIWKVRGIVSNVSNSNFKVGTLLVNLGSQPDILCQQDLNDGDLVELKMAPDSAYQVGFPINTLLSIECIGLNQLSSQIMVIPTVVQGFISLPQGNKFQLDDIEVITSNTTLYKNGERQFIDNAVNVEVQGILDTEKSELHADVVRFLDHRIEVTFPIEPADVIINESINIHGLKFYMTPQTKDNTNILTNGLNAASQIQVLGYVDSSGKAYLSKVQNRGAVDFNKINIRGDIFALDNPFFELLNFTIDSSMSLIINQAMGVIDVEMFFNLVNVGSQLEIKNAKYDPESDQISGGMISIKEIIEDLTVNTHEIIGSGIIRGFGTATVTSTSDLLFRSTF